MCVCLAESYDDDNNEDSSNMATAKVGKLRKQRATAKVGKLRTDEATAKVGKLRKTTGNVVNLIA